MSQRRKSPASFRPPLDPNAPSTPLMTAVGDTANSNSSTTNNLPSDTYLESSYRRSIPNVNTSYQNPSSPRRNRSGYAHSPIYPRQKSIWSSLGFYAKAHWKDILLIGFGGIILILVLVVVNSQRVTGGDMKPVDTSKDPNLAHLNTASSTTTTVLQKLTLTDLTKDTEPVLPGGHLLDPLMVPRVVGTPGHSAVRKYLIGALDMLGFEVALDTFTDKTPLGTKEFTNIIGSILPDAPKRLVLSAHFDSKYFPNPQDKFIGATDSSVPCAMLLDIAKKLGASIKQAQDGKNVQEQVGLDIVFFDGEEAFVQWTETDSVYGSRHLAAKWEKEGRLKRIELFVLLDLIGHKMARFQLLTDSGSKGYKQFVEIEKDLQTRNLIQKDYSTQDVQRFGPNYFTEYSHTQNGIEDDHVPFLKRNVPVLHLISTPFPEKWHTLQDDAEHLDKQAITNLVIILRVWVAKYFSLI